MVSRGNLFLLNMLRWITLLFLVVAASQTFAAQDIAPVTIVVSGLPNDNATDASAVAQQRVVQAFLQAHPHVRLRPAEGIRIENVTPEATMIMMIAGGIAPDVIQLSFRSLDTFVSQGILQPLDQFADREPGGLQAIFARIIPQLRKAITRIGPEGKEHLYALPGQPLMMGLYFNKVIFRRAGLPERAPKTWDEMLAFARQIRERLGNEVNPIALQPGSFAGWNLVNFIWSAGGEIVREVAPNEWRVCFDSAEAAMAYEFYYRLVEGERLANRNRDTSARTAQRTGMRFGYVGEALGFDPQRTGFGAVPKGPTGLRGGEINAVLYGVFSGIKDPARQKAAWDYIMFITGETAERIRTSTFVEMGQANLVSPIALQKFGFSQYLSLAPKGLAEEIEEALVTSKPEPYGRNCNLVYAELSYPLDRILLDRDIASAWGANNMKEVRERIAAILSTAVKKTNERMIGYVPPSEMRLRRIVAGVAAAAVFSGFIVLGVFITRSFSSPGSPGGLSVTSKSVLPWLILIPAIVLVIVWSYLPLARGTVMAFLDYKILLPSTFVGLDNFANVLFDETFWNSILVTLVFAAYTLTLGFITPILLAYALHVIPKWKVAYRLVYYLPAVLSAAAVFFLWFELFQADGILNQALRLLGFSARRAWTEDPSLAMLACVIPGVWGHAGPACLIYLAALKTIPAEQFEAAEIDGAGFRQKTRLIIWPGLKPLIIINFVGAVAAAFHGATNILIMTGGGPNRGTEVTSLLIFFEAFTRMRFGTATAMAWIIASMLIGFTVIQLQRLKRMEFKATS